jgi:hypothetical protein
MAHAQRKHDGPLSLADIQPEHISPFLCPQRIGLINTIAFANVLASYVSAINIAIFQPITFANRSAQSIAHEASHIADALSDTHKRANLGANAAAIIPALTITHIQTDRSANLVADDPTHPAADDGFSYSADHSCPHTTTYNAQSDPAHDHQRPVSCAHSDLRSIHRGQCSLRNDLGSEPD